MGFLVPHFLIGRIVLKIDSSSADRIVGDVWDHVGTASVIPIAGAYNISGIIPTVLAPHLQVFRSFQILTKSNGKYHLSWTVEACVTCAELSAGAFSYLACKRHRGGACASRSKDMD